MVAVLFIHTFHPFKHLWVEAHVVGMLCEYGAHLLCQCIHFIVGFGAEQVEEHCRHIIEQVIIAIIVEGVDDGVFECGSLGV